MSEENKNLEEEYDNKITGRYVSKFYPDDFIAIPSEHVDITDYEENKILYLRSNNDDIFNSDDDNDEGEYEIFDSVFGYIKPNITQYRRFDKYLLTHDNKKLYENDLVDFVLINFRKNIITGERPVFVGNLVCINDSLGVIVSNPIAVKEKNEDYDDENDSYDKKYKNKYIKNLVFVDIRDIEISSFNGVCKYSDIRYY